MSAALRFTIPGQAAPQGSKNAYQRGGRIVLVESSSKLPAWRAEAVRCASGAVQDSSCDFPLDGPIWVRLTFHLQVPKRRRDAWPIKRPDVDKLTRAALDALTIAGVWRDDSQVAWLSARKVWALGDARTDVELGEL